VIEVGRLTEALITHLQVQTSPALVIGDGIAPREGGWQQGQPNVHVFRPYAVVITGPATMARPDRVAPNGSEWSVSYSVRTFAGSPSQLRTYYQRVRNAVDTFNKVLFGADDAFKVVHAQFEQLGSETRDDSVDPPYWQVFDAVRVEASRSRFQPP
jgi:hypothetical protein